MLTLQFGQCGNQLGHSFFSKISNDIDSKTTGVSPASNYDYVEESFHRFFSDLDKNGKRVARAILVDTEEKAVREISKTTPGTWTYRARNTIFERSGGSANNWAFGYTENGGKLGKPILELARQELENLDHFSGFLLLLSSAGGTGSGVGSRTLEMLKDEHPTKCIVSSVTLPFSFGEVGAQNYNTLFTLTKFHESSDVTLLFENDQLHKICQGIGGHESIEFSDINEIASQKLLSFFQPVHERASIGSLVARVASHPGYKFASIKSTPHVLGKRAPSLTSSNWQPYIRHLKHTLRVPTLGGKLTDAETKVPNFSQKSTNATRSFYSFARSLSNVLITRGSGRPNDAVNLQELQDKSMYANWVSRSDGFSHLSQSRRILNQEKFVTLISNNSETHRPLESLLEKAWNYYVHAAFLHRYKEHGVEENDFLKAFASIESVSRMYKELQSNGC